MTILAGTSTTDLTTEAAVFRHSDTFQAVMSARYSSVSSSSGGGSGHIKHKEMFCIGHVKHKDMFYTGHVKNKGIFCTGNLKNKETFRSLLS